MGSGCSTQKSTYDPAVLSIEHFEMHRVVGQGGFGKVNAVIRKGTKPPQWFALKTLSKAVILQKRCSKMIWNERNLLAQLDSPYVVKMHHTFQDFSNCYVVMDLLPGGDLKFHLSGKYKRGFPEHHARFYIAGLLEALRYLHANQVLHRDIKPGNVILDNQGYPRLTDMGVSVKSETLRYKGNSGTTSYMAPEMFVGSNEHGVTADFYALGILAGELLFGRRLWMGSARNRIDQNPDILDDLPAEKESDYYPPECLDAATSSPLSSTCRSFLRGLLYPAEAGRLGAQGGADEVMRHAWFSDFDWAAFEAKTMEPPFQPTIDENNANCDTAAQDFDDVLEQSARNTKKDSILEEHQRSFDGFEFNVDLLSTAAVTQ